MIDIVIFLGLASALYIYSNVSDDNMNMNKYIIITSLFGTLLITTADTVDKRDKKIFELVEIIEDHNISLDVDTYAFLENIKISND